MLFFSMLNTQTGVEKQFCHYFFGSEALMSEYILQMQDISKSFHGIKVLKNVTLLIKAGEVHALMGENGAGKSTLMKILMGIYSADSGEITMDGNSIINRSPRQAMERGISMIHQELNPVMDMMVFENVFMGRELRNSAHLVDKRREIQVTRSLLKDMNIPISEMAYMRDLSVAQCQLVEIVKAISIKAKIIIMDEPTSAITEDEVDTLFQHIENLRKQNVAIIYISHKMSEIFRISDRITVLRDGEMIICDHATAFDQNSLIRYMVGREITDVYPKITAPIGEVIMKVENICYSSKVKNASFEVRKGEILGVGGLVGAGRTELVETIFGVRRKKSGRIFKCGRELNITHPKHAIANGMALISEDRKIAGLDLIASVRDNITMASLKQVSRHGLLNQTKEKIAAKKYITKLSIKTPSDMSYARNLSGGNQQKVVIGKWLMTNADVIIMDEPTRGIDVGAKHDIYLLIGELAKQEKAIIIISSEIPELMGICDRIIVMAEGKITGEVPRNEFSQEKILTLATKF